MTHCLILSHFASRYLFLRPKYKNIYRTRQRVRKACVGSTSLRSSPSRRPGRRALCCWLAAAPGGRPVPPPPRRSRPRSVSRRNCKGSPPPWISCARSTRTTTGWARPRRSPSCSRRPRRRTRRRRRWPRSWATSRGRVHRAGLFVPTRSIAQVMARVKRAGVAVDDALRAAASREPAGPLSSQSCDHPGSPRWRPLSFARARMRNASRPSGPFPRERRPTSVVASPQPRGAATTRSSARTWPRRRPTRTRSRRWTTPP